MSVSAHPMFSVSGLVEVSGEAANARKQLTEQLRVNGIDPQPALQNLGQKNDAEAVADLVSFAREQGYCVEFGLQGPGDIDILIRKPSTVRMLQSGHHRSI